MSYGAFSFTVKVAVHKSKDADPMSKWRMSQNNSVQIHINGACPRVKMAPILTGSRPRVKKGAKMAAVGLPGVGSRCEVVGPVRQVRPFNGEHVVVTS
jgi:hypothetical protein